MTRGEIAVALSGTPRVINFGALNYAVPTLKWLRGDFWNFFYRTVWGDNLQKWQVRWECRDFARAYACLAQVCWASTQTPSDEDGIAVGEMWFNPDPAKPNVGHAICPVFTENGLQFIDPQSNDPCEISGAQLSSCYFLRF